MNQKNLLIFLIFTLVGLATFLGGYILAGKNNLGKTANISQLGRFSESKDRDLQSKTSATSEAGQQRLSTVKAISPAISEDGRSVVYFEKGTGRLLSTDFSGQDTKVVAGKTIEGTSEAVWSKNGFEVIFNNTYLNTKTGMTSKLNSGISGITWSDDGKKIAYLFLDKNTGENNISIANPDGSLFKNVFKTRADNLKIAWPSSSLLSFHNPSGQDKSLFVLDIESGKLQKVLSSLDNLKILWSPDSSKLLYSFRDLDGIEQVKISDRKNGIELDLGIVTNADKCVWTLNSLLLYCGAKKEDGLPEQLYQLDVAEKKFVVAFTPNPAEPITIEKPILSPTENRLFFINKNDGYLYNIKLPN